MHKKLLELQTKKPYYIDRRINEKKILLESP